MYIITVRKSQVHLKIDIITIRSTNIIIINRSIGIWIFIQIVTIVTSIIISLFIDNPEIIF